MDLELSDKVAVVTDASKGIGLAVTRTLAGEGARVVAGARRSTGMAASMSSSTTWAGSDCAPRGSSPSTTPNSSGR
jgi:NAD(P)-dependent dehydrogenase (short-subunit alcohol dehydrogenase family)